MAARKKDADPSALPHIPICGIGASAGGIEALREFFGVLPPDLGLAYVVVVHLAPHHESELAPILARRTRMDVVSVDDNKKLDLKPNCVRHLSGSQARDPGRQGRRRPIRPATRTTQRRRSVLSIPRREWAMISHVTSVQRFSADSDAECSSTIVPGSIAISLSCVKRRKRSRACSMTC
jgi:hypothetical protein